MDSARLTARYIYQVVVGCTDPECAALFCAQKAQRSFQGRRIALSAAPALACQLASLKGATALCAVLQADTLPDEIGRQINEQFPMKSQCLHPPGVNSDAFSTGAISNSTVEPDPAQSLQHEPAPWNWLNGLTRRPSGQQTRNPPEVSVSTPTKRGLAAHIMSSSMFSEWSVVNRLANLTSPGLYYTLEILLCLKLSKESLPRLLTAVNELSQYIVTGLPSGLLTALLHSLGRFSGHSTLFSKLSTTLLPSLIANRGFRAPFIFELDTILRHSVTASAQLMNLWMLPQSQQAWQQGASQSPVAYSNALGDEIPDFKSLDFPITAFSGALPEASDNYFQRLSLPQAEYLHNTDMFRIIASTNGSDIYLFRCKCLAQMLKVTQRVRAANDFITTLLPFNYDRRLRRLGTSYASYPSSMNPNTFFLLEVHRDNILQSAVNSLVGALHAENHIRRPLKVRFFPCEIGVDIGGVQTEFFHQFGNQLVFSGHGYFTVDLDSRLAYFNPGFSGNTKHYQYLGMLFGLAMYNGCMVDIRFPLCLYRFFRLPIDKWLDSLSMDDFAELFPTAARSLAQLLSHQGNWDDLSLEFVYPYDSDTGVRLSMELPSQKKFNNTVTAECLSTYVREYINCALYGSVQAQLDAFREGVLFVVNKDLVAIMATSRLRDMIEGSSEINIDELKASASYERFTVTSKTIQWFWSVVAQFDQHHKELLLEFVTGSCRVPIGGLDKLNFVILRNGIDDSRMPSSAVCFSRLLLPEYSSRDTLQQRLLQAIEHSQGFGLV